VQSSNLKVELGDTFNKIWSAAMFSKFADGLIGAAIPLLAASLTRDPILIAIQANLFMLPWLIFAIPIGALLDRLNRRTAMLMVQSSRVLIGAALALLIVTGQMNLVWLASLTFVFGVSEVVYDTATQSAIPSLLSDNQLEKGNSRLQIADTVMQGFVGVPLGGYIFAILAFIPFFGVSACYLVAIVLVLSISKNALQPKVDPTAPKRPPLGEEIKEGLHYLWSQKTLLRLVLTTGFIGFCYSMGGATQVLFILDHLAVPEANYGWVLVPLGVGALIGAFTSARFSSRLGRSSALAIALPASALSLLLCGLSPNVYWFMGACFMQGFFIAHWNILLMSTYHSMIPNEIFGRIHGARRTIVWGLMPVGGLLGGILAKIDLTLPLIVGGIMATVLAISAISFIRSIET
jgi:MFS family permease